MKAKIDRINLGQDEPSLKNNDLDYIHGVPGVFARVHLPGSFSAFRASRRSARLFCSAEMPVSYLSFIITGEVNIVQAAAKEGVAQGVGFPRPAPFDW